MVEENRVGFSRVRSPQKNGIRVFDLAIRTSPTACSENRRQTGDAGGMSSAVATVDVIRPHDAANEFLRRVVQFVGGLRATEHAKVTRIVFVDRLAERRGDAVHGFVPRSGTKRSILAHQRLGQAGCR
jgi:hypothetical protein